MAVCILADSRTVTLATLADAAAGWPQFRRRFSFAGPDLVDADNRVTAADLELCGAMDGQVNHLAARCVTAGHRRNCQCDSPAWRCCGSGSAGQGVVEGSAGEGSAEERRLVDLDAHGVAGRAAGRLGPTRSPARWGVNPCCRGRVGLACPLAGRPEVSSETVLAAPGYASRSCSTWVALASRPARRGWKVPAHPKPGLATAELSCASRNVAGRVAFPPLQNSRPLPGDG